MKDRGSGVLSTVEISLMSALTVICSRISVPASPPVTLQLFAIALSLLLLGGKRGCASVLLYLAAGAVGLPVWSSFAGGFGHLFSAGGGYLIGFIIGALIYAALERLLPKRDVIKLGLLIIFTIIVYIIGTLWFALVYAPDSVSGILSAIAVCVLPYVIPDAIKIALAFVIYKRLKGHRG